MFKWSDGAWTTISPPTPGTYSAVAVNPQNKDQVVVSSSSFSPYKFNHYRSQDGTKADLEELKRLVGVGSEIRVREWYPGK